MIYNKTNNESYENTKTAKKALGIRRFKDALKNNELRFIDDRHVRTTPKKPDNITALGLTYLLKGVIYVRTLKTTGEKYVGQTENIDKRNNHWKCHKSPYGGAKIDSARKKYGTGENNWSLELVEIFAPTKKKLTEELDKAETNKIIELDTVNNGLNISYGRGMKGLHHIDETKAKISQTLTGIKRSGETKKKISEAKKLWWATKKLAVTTRENRCIRA